MATNVEWEVLPTKQEEDFERSLKLYERLGELNNRLMVTRDSEEIKRIQMALEELDQSGLTRT
jgi:hypothetical protein